MIGSLIAAQAISFGGCGSGVTTPEEENIPYIEHQNEETNQEGQVTFETGETLQIIDQETQEPLEDIIIDYYTDDSEEYRVLTITDETQTYLPTRRYLSDFENETIPLQRSENQEYPIRQLSENEREPFMKFMKEYMDGQDNQQRTTDCSNYIGSVRGEELYHGDIVMDALITYFVPAGGVISELVNFFQNLGAIEEGYENFGEMVLSSNWDSYSKFGDSYSLITNILVESNAPEVEMTHHFNEEGKLILEAIVRDSGTYECGSLDKTVSCRGETELHDYGLRWIYDRLDEFNYIHYQEWPTNQEDLSIHQQTIPEGGGWHGPGPGEWRMRMRVYDDTIRVYPNGFDLVNVTFSDWIYVNIE